MNYQKLVNDCKEYYKNGNLKRAYQCWCDIHEILLNKLDKFDEHDEENRYQCYKEFQEYINQFTNNEVYDITDYGKEQYYKEMGYL